MLGCWTDEGDTSDVYANGVTSANVNRLFFGASRAINDEERAKTLRQRAACDAHASGFSISNIGLVLRQQRHHEPLLMWRAWSELSGGQAPPLVVHHSPTALLSGCGGQQAEK